MLFDRNTIVGFDFLIVGIIVVVLGFIVAQSIPIASLGFAIAIVGALILLVVPEAIPQDSFKSLIADSITNMELLLEEAGLRDRAYFVRLGDSEKVRAFIPLRADTTEGKKDWKGIETASSSSVSAALLSIVGREPLRLIANEGELKGLLVVPPGNEIVKLANVLPGEDLEEVLRRVLVELTDLAKSILVLDNAGPEGPSRNEVRVLAKTPAIFSESPYFNSCLGSPVASVVASVVAAAKSMPVRIVDEKYDDSQTRIVLQLVE